MEENTYLALLNLITLLSSEYADKIRERYPDLLIKIESIRSTYEFAYIIKKKATDNNIKELYDISVELKETLDIIDQSSHDSIKKLENELNIVSKNLQNLAYFNPISFYNRYLLSVISPMNNSIVKEVMKDERFVLWFGKSKVVDENNQPLMLYHGTNRIKKEFDEFKFNLFPGAYFAVNKSYSEWFAKGTNSHLYQVFLRIENPIDITAYSVDKVTYDDFVTYLELRYALKLPENKLLRAMSDAQDGIWAWKYLRFAPDWLKYIQSLNYYDGFIYYENNPDDIINGVENVTKAYLVFKANQIKSADTRNTTYSLESNSIKMLEGGILC